MNSSTSGQKVSLSKVTLEKKGDKVSLEKPINSIGHGRIVCNLNWEQKKTKKWLFGKSDNGGKVDLDLGCLYELADGTKRVVQALGNSFGSYETAPFIHLAGDDRTGSNAQGEFLYVNGDHLSDINRICIFAFIYEGVANWKDANAFVTVTVPGHPMIEVRLDDGKDNLGMCAITMIENNKGQLKVTKLGKYFKGHQDLDKHYKWGLRWTSGSK